MEAVGGGGGRFSPHSAQERTSLLFLSRPLSALSSQHLCDFRTGQIRVLGPQLTPPAHLGSEDTAPSDRLQGPGRVRGSAISTSWFFTKISSHAFAHVFNLTREWRLIQERKYANG